MLYQHYQTLWIIVKGEKAGQYRVLESEGYLSTGRRIGKLGKLASQLRVMGEKKFWNDLPKIPDAIRESITGMAERQRNWTPEEPEMTEQELAASEIGRWR